MKLTTRNLLIVLVILGAAYAVSQLTKRSGRSKSLRSELVAIDTSKVSRIEITSLEGEVQLSDSDEGWKVALADGSEKQAKPTAITSLLASLNTIKPDRLAAKSASKWKDYAVDSAGTRVMVYEGEALATDIVIGRFGMEGQQSFYTFVRLSDEEEVYVAKGFMGMSIGKEPASYRENTLLRLMQDSLNVISFSYPDSSFTLTKGQQWYLADQEADSAAVVQFLNGLGFVSSRAFYDEPIVGVPSHTITFSYSNQPEITVEAFALEGALVVRSSENPQEAFLDEALVKKVFKGENAFLTTSD